MKWFLVFLTELIFLLLFLPKATIINLTLASGATFSEYFYCYIISHFQAAFQSCSLLGWGSLVARASQGQNRGGRANSARAGN